MTLNSDAAMLLFCDFDGDVAEHDDWHTYEHLHERLSIPGFLRGTRWTARSGHPRYLIVYEVASLDVATSPHYLARLNDPTPWTASIMPRLRGMVRGFCRVAGSAGYGLGTVASSLRFRPMAGREDDVRAAIADVLPVAASQPGMASVHLFEPAARPPMTREQSLRGVDAEMPWVVLATAYDAGALERVTGAHLAKIAARKDLASPVEAGVYAMQFTATAGEVLRTPANPQRGKPP